MPRNPLTSAKRTFGWYNIDAMHNFITLTGQASGFDYRCPGAIQAANNIW
jgi:hypothetical protein